MPEDPIPSPAAAPQGTAVTLRIGGERIMIRVQTEIPRLLCQGEKCLRTKASAAQFVHVGMQTGSGRARWLQDVWILRDEPSYRAECRKSW